MDEDDYQPISALNDLLFCERRCALHRLEGIWQDNVATMEGTIRHKRAHAESTENVGDVTTIRGLWLISHELRLVGKADVVEMRPTPFPIEYKRGRKRRWDNDDVQLCAQAMCLEEMLGVSVPAGAIYHVRSKRRREIEFDLPLRWKTEQAARRLHELIATGETPPPIPKPRCEGCSLKAICMPKVIDDQAVAIHYFKGLFQVKDGPMDP